MVIISRRKVSIQKLRDAPNGSPCVFVRAANKRTQWHIYMGGGSKGAESSVVIHI